MKLSRSCSVSDDEKRRGPSTVEGEICRQLLKSTTSSSHKSRLGGNSMTSEPSSSGTPSCSVRPSSGTPSTRGEPRRSSEVASTSRWCEMRTAACLLSSSRRPPVAAFEMSSCRSASRRESAFGSGWLVHGVSSDGPTGPGVSSRSHHVLRTSAGAMLASGTASRKPLACAMREAMCGRKCPR
eukprot:scaffold65303_cov28-Tisochrysis_lutea.AAC.3